MPISYPQIGALNLNGVDEFGVQWVTDKDGVKGWGAPQGTLEVVQKTRQSGGWAGLSYPKPRPMTVSGTAVAPSVELASDALDRLNDACSLDDTLLTVVESGRSRWCTVRRDGEVIPAWLSEVAFTWSVQFVALDPRKFADQLTATTVLPSSSGGLVYPHVYPYEIDAVTVSGQVSLENVGNIAGPVTLRIDGPCTGPVITHVGSGLALVFASSLVLGAGEWLTVDMEARSVMANDQASRSGYVVSRGWSQFTPGMNTWAFTAASYDPASRLTVTATPAWK